MKYEFTFVVAGATVDDDTAVTRIEEGLDAMLARAGGQHFLSISHDADNAVEAAIALSDLLRAHVPGLRLRRLDRGLVGIHEIAERTDRSRQNVHHWATGASLADGSPFPATEGTVGKGQAWLWAEVNDWLRQHGLDDGMYYPSREEMAHIDHILASTSQET